MRAASLGRGLLLPDPEVAWAPDAVRAGTRDRARARDRRRAHHLAALVRAPDRRRRSRAARACPGWPTCATPGSPTRTAATSGAACAPSARSRSASRAARCARAAAVIAVTPFIRDEAASLAPPGTPRARSCRTASTSTTSRGSSTSRRSRLRLLHAGSFFGQRTPRPFLEALAALLRRRPELRGLVEARFLGDVPPGRPRVGRSTLGLGDCAAHRGLPAPRRDAGGHEGGGRRSCCSIPHAGGRGRSVLSGKVYEYLAAERPVLALVPPDGAAADLLRATGRRWIADPDDDDAIRRGLDRGSSTTGQAGGSASARCRRVARAARPAHPRGRDGAVLRG